MSSSCLRLERGQGTQITMALCMWPAVLIVADLARSSILTSERLHCFFYSSIFFTSQLYSSLSFIARLVGCLRSLLVISFRPCFNLLFGFGFDTLQKYHIFFDQAGLDISFILSDFFDFHLAIASGHYPSLLYHGPVIGFSVYVCPLHDLF